MRNFWKKPRFHDPQLGNLLYSNQQWVSEEISTPVGNILVSLDGDRSAPNSASLMLARNVLTEPTAYVELAMSFVRNDSQARDFMEHQGDLILDGFSFFSTQSVHVDLALSEWPDAMINVVFKEGVPCNVLLAD